MIQRVPAEYHRTVGAVDFLESSFRHPALDVRYIDAAQVVRHLLVDGQESACTVIQESKLVLICWRLVGTRFERFDNFVVSVQDDAMTSSVSKQLVAEEAAQMIAALVTADVEVVCVVRTNLAEASIDQILHIGQKALAGKCTIMYTPNLSKM